MNRVLFGFWSLQGFKLSVHSQEIFQVSLDRCKSVLMVEKSLLSLSAQQINFLIKYVFDPDWLNANNELTMFQLLVVAEWRYLLKATCFQGSLTGLAFLFPSTVFLTNVASRLEKPEENVVAPSVAVNNSLRENLLFAFVSLII